MFVGCSKDDDETSPSSNNNSNNQTEEDQMIFSVDGVERDFSDEVSFGRLGAKIVVEGREESTYPTEELEVSFPDSTSTGTYSIDENSIVNATFRKVDSSVWGDLYGDIYTTIDGTLDLTHINVVDFEARGTFSFTAVNRDDSQDTVVVSGGKFNSAGTGL